MTSLQPPKERKPDPSISVALRKTSSEDFIAASALPRSRSSSFCAHYTESIRRQRSDTFVHAHQQTVRKSKIYQDALPTVIPPIAPSQLCSSIIESDSESEEGGEDIDSRSPAMEQQTGAIIEGVLMRRAVRPHPIQQSKTSKEGKRKERELEVELSKTEITQKNNNDESQEWNPPLIDKARTSIPTDNITRRLQSGETVPIPSLSKSNKVFLQISVKDRLAHKKTHKNQENEKHSLFHFHRRFHRYDTSKPLYDDGSQLVYPPFINNEDNEVDRYGFRKSSQWISIEKYHEFERLYAPVLERRQARWQQFMDENGGKFPDRSTKLRRYIRKGIPAHLRGRAWLHYSGAEGKMDANPGVYQKFVAKARELGNENEFADIIERDLHRTFPENVQFRSDASAGIPSTDHVPAIAALRRVLSAFSVYCPSIGYCQSLNFVVGMLLLFMKEEEAFWTMVTIVQNILPAGVYDVTMEGSNLDQNVLMMLLWERMPTIWSKMSDKSFWESEEDGVSMPTITLVTSHWFLTLFINILPIETVLRVWDCFF
ncbi:hypothetical protein EC973_004871 [Apophysomyces ossiformis]|uniref:Rab-GAP TBC domain-containing protein n=1 Tax=Apophysomyces ossiformis TaxID=679940 RepID=A0A8H7EL88_9FUNG|nr:hypothetical protein EC973_004871 [Apophysomyces ossiformis]